MLPIPPALESQTALLYSRGSSHCWLASFQSRTTQPLRSSPITGPSTLLRVAPPLCPASVLFAGTARLDFSLGIGATGSHVPRKSQMQSHAALHAGCHPNGNQASSGLLPG